MTNIIFASDLDNTLIYSQSKIKGGICVEIYHEHQQGFMTERTYENFGKMTENVRFIPPLIFGLAAKMPFGSCFD